MLRDDDRHSPISDIPTYVMVDQHGHEIRVSPVYFSGPNAPYPPSRALRWAVTLISDRELEDTKKRSWVGPPIGRDRSFEAIACGIGAWWVRDDRTTPDPQGICVRFRHMNVCYEFISRLGVVS